MEFGRSLKYVMAPTSSWKGCSSIRAASASDRQPNARDLLPCNRRSHSGSGHDKSARGGMCQTLLRRGTTVSPDRAARSSASENLERDGRLLGPGLSARWKSRSRKGNGSAWGFDGYSCLCIHGGLDGINGIQLVLSVSSDPALFDLPQPLCSSHGRSRSP